MVGRPGRNSRRRSWYRSNSISGSMRLDRRNVPGIVIVIVVVAIHIVIGSSIVVMIIIIWWRRRIRVSRSFSRGGRTIFYSQERIDQIRLVAIVIRFFHHSHQHLPFVFGAPQLHWDNYFVD